MYSYTDVRRGTDINCFQIIRSVLVELYDKLPEPWDERSKDELIKNKLRELREDYALLPYGKIPDYADSYKQFAYLYCYVPAHANILYRLIDWNLSRIFNTNQVKVSCFGGGPGSDLLGIVKFMEERGDKSARLKCDVYDKENFWRRSLGLICKNTKKSFTASSSFNMLDIAESYSWNKYPTIFNSDLFIMSYFVSEIYSMRRQSAIFFTTLFKKSKRGTHFLVVDNCSGESRCWLDSLIETYNKRVGSGFWENLGNSDNEICTMPLYEQKTDLEPFYEKFRHVSEPKTLGKEKPFAYRIYRKL